MAIVDTDNPKEEDEKERKKERGAYGRFTVTADDHEFIPVVRACH